MTPYDLALLAAAEVLPQNLQQRARAYAREQAQTHDDVVELDLSELKDGRLDNYRLAWSQELAAIHRGHDATFRFFSDPVWAELNGPDTDVQQIILDAHARRVQLIDKAKSDELEAMERAGKADLPASLAQAQFTSEAAIHAANEEWLSARVDAARSGQTAFHTSVLAYFQALSDAAHDGSRNTGASKEDPLPDLEPIKVKHSYTGGCSPEALAASRQFARTGVWIGPMPNGFRVFLVPFLRLRQDGRGEQHWSPIVVDRTDPVLQVLIEDVQRRVADTDVKANQALVLGWLSRYIRAWMDQRPKCSITASIISKHAFGSLDRRAKPTNLGYALRFKVTNCMTSLILKLLADELGVAPQERPLVLMRGKAGDSSAAGSHFWTAQQELDGSYTLWDAALNRVGVPMDTETYRVAAFPAFWLVGNQEVNTQVQRMHQSMTATNQRLLSMSGESGSLVQAIAPWNASWANVSNHVSQGGEEVFFRLFTRAFEAAKALDKLLLEDRDNDQWPPAAVMRGFLAEVVSHLPRPLWDGMGPRWGDEVKSAVMERPEQLQEFEAILLRYYGRQ